MITWKLALFALFGLSPFVTSQPSPSKPDEKKPEATPARIQVEVKATATTPSEPAKAALTEVKKVEAPKVVSGKAILLQKAEPAKAEVKKTDEVKIVSGQNIIIQKVEAPKTDAKGEEKTITITKTEGPKDGVKKDEAKIGFYKFEGKSEGTPHVLHLQVSPSGEVKVQKAENEAKKTITVVGTPIQDKLVQVKPKEGMETALFVPLDRKLVVEAKPEAPQGAGTKTLELRITIDGNNPPKVEVLKGPEAKALEWVKPDAIKKVETRAIEIKTPEKAKPGQKEEIKKVEVHGSGHGVWTGSIGGGEIKVPTLPGTGVMKFVFTEDGKTLKVESDGKAKTEVLQLEAAIRAAEKVQADAQARAEAFRKKAESLRQQAMKDAAEAKARSEKAIAEMKPIIIQDVPGLKDLEKQIRVKVLGEVKDIQKVMEAKLVEAKIKVDQEQDKFEQLSKRLDKLEKAIDELYKKVK